MRFGVVAICALAFAVMPFSTASAIGLEDIVDGENNYPWVQVELPGTVCGNGSQYRFYHYDSPTSDNLLVYFEGGGACWDFDSCSGREGILGAANSNGIPDGYIEGFLPKFVAPLVNGNDPGIPFRSRTDIVTKGWDVVYMPYCTGDVHVGNSVITYVDPLGQEPDLLWHHNGYNNTIAALNHLSGVFPNVNKLLVSGFSAGGVATGVGYYFARQILSPNKGYMINDSGPVFPAGSPSSNSRPLHDTITASWDLPSVFDQLPATFDDSDFGSINVMMAVEFPNDQLAYTGYSRDFNFSRFSYERFYPGITPEGILTKWKQDQDALVAQLSQYANFSYNIPWERQINDSHCSTIITFIGSHNCPSIRKKRWYEVWQWPWSQSWKCPGTFQTMEDFIDGFVGQDRKYRLVEPPNGYNAEDPGMQIVAPLINDAISGA
jgi:hypothetical protein